MLAEGQVTLLRVPVDAFLRAVWSLIEDHGIVVQLDVPGGAARCKRVERVLAPPSDGPCQ